MDCNNYILRFSIKWDFIIKNEYCMYNINYNFDIAKDIIYKGLVIVI